MYTVHITLSQILKEWGKKNNFNENGEVKNYELIDLTGLYF